MAGRIFTAKLSGGEKETSGSLFRREQMRLGNAKGSEQSVTINRGTEIGGTAEG
jgi:hypothetical protein